jgi:hypothetical protein
MASKDWDAALAEQRGEPIHFVLGGEEFVCTPPLPAVAYIEFVARSSDPTSPRAKDTAVFIAECLDDEDKVAAEQRFLAAVRKARASVTDLEQLGKWLIEEASGRPTERQSDLDTSAATTGDESRDDSASQASRPTLVATG